MDNNITHLLSAWRTGDGQALDQLVQSLAPELRRMAAGYMRKESFGHTLQATAVVNEAYLRLYDADVQWQDRAHFLSVASTTMRRILVDHARGKGREKRGGDMLQVTFDEAMSLSNQDQCDVLVLDEALTQLAEFDARGAQVLEMRIFGGMTMIEVAEALDVSVATAERSLKSVRAWMFKRLSGDG